MKPCKSCGKPRQRITKHPNQGMNHNLRTRCRDCVLGVVNKPAKKARKVA